PASRRHMCSTIFPYTTLFRSVRTYPAPRNLARGANALQTYKLRRVIEAMKARLAEAFCLPYLAQIAGLSDYHFSRLFKRATGLSDRKSTRLNSSHVKISYAVF